MSLNHPTPNMDHLLHVLAPGVLIMYGCWNIFRNHYIAENARNRIMQLAYADDEDDVAERYGSSNYYAQGTSVWARAFNNLQRSRQLISETLPVAILSACVGSLYTPSETFSVTLAYCGCSQGFLNRLADPRLVVEADETEKKNRQLLRQGMHLSLGVLALLGLYSLSSFVFDGDVLGVLTEHAVQAVVDWLVPFRRQASSMPNNQRSYASSTVAVPKQYRRYWPNFMGQQK